MCMISVLWIQVDFVMSQLSYFHLGHLTIKDSEPHITSLYTLVEVQLIVDTTRYSTYYTYYMHHMYIETTQTIDDSTNCT